MTKKEILKKFPFSGNFGECFGCEYVDQGDKILPDFVKPRKCGGLFYADDTKMFE